jgi:hypothetical protein
VLGSKMSTLWGSKKSNGQPGDEGEGGDRPRSSRDREPTERDRLLPANPRPPHSDGYLDPDDPAVS